MYTAAQYRTAAVEFANRANFALNERERAEYKTLESSFKTLADNADWLTANDSKVVHSSGERQALPEREPFLSHNP